MLKEPSTSRQGIKEIKKGLSHLKKTQQKHTHSVKRIQGSTAPITRLMPADFVFHRTLLNFLNTCRKTQGQSSEVSEADLRRKDTKGTSYNFKFRWKMGDILKAIERRGKCNKIHFTKHGAAPPMCFRVCVSVGVLRSPSRAAAEWRLRRGGGGAEGHESGVDVR